MRIQPTLQSSFAFLFVLFAFVNSLAAQEHISIKGTVTDKTTGTALGNVNVFVSGTKFGAVSDKEGRYVIENLPNGVGITARATSDVRYLPVIYRRRNEQLPCFW